jgi:hypothetical protein
MSLVHFYLQRFWLIRFQYRWTLVGNSGGIHTVFQDEKSRKNYDKDSKHLAFPDLLMPALEDGMDSVLSFDMRLPDGFSDFLRK